MARSLWSRLTQRIPNIHDIIIPVIGGMNIDKSKLISAINGIDKLQDAIPSPIIAYSIKMPNVDRRIILLDTPNLEDDKKNSISLQIQLWIDRNYASPDKHGLFVHGIIYLFDASQPPPSADNLSSVAARFSPVLPAGPCFVLGTTGWDLANDGPQFAQDLHQTLQSRFSGTDPNVSVARLAEPDNIGMRELLSTLLERIKTMESQQGCFIYGLPTDRVVLVVGQTGCGKSTFLNHLADGRIQSRMEVDNRALSAGCTENVSAFVFDGVGKGRIVVADTPPFNDPRTETDDDQEIFDRIQEWITTNYGSSFRVSAVISLQDASSKFIERYEKDYKKQIERIDAKKFIYGMTKMPSEEELTGLRLSHVKGLMKLYGKRSIKDEPSAAWDMLREVL